MDKQERWKVYTQTDFGALWYGSYCMLEVQRISKLELQLLKTVADILNLECQTNEFEKLKQKIEEILETVRSI